MAIEKMKICLTNILADITPVASGSAANFPLSRIYDTDYKSMWRSLSGYSSGWGTFIITTSNNKLNFNEGGSELTATITAGTYTADELAAEIVTRMDAAGANTYAVSFVEAGVYEFKWKIARATGSNAVNLLCNTGTDIGTDIWGDIGYSNAADRTGATEYWGDDQAIHTEEIITWDMTAAVDFEYFAFIGHNLTASAVVKVEFSTDNFSSTAESLAMTRCAGSIYALTWDTAKQYRYVRLWLWDPANTDGYVSLGYVAAGEALQPATNFKPTVEKELTDPSIITPSMGGQESAIQYDQFNMHNYAARVKGDTEHGYYKAHIDAVGTSVPFFFAEDPGDLANYMFFVIANTWYWRVLNYATKLRELSFSFRDAR